MLAYASDLIDRSGAVPLIESWLKQDDSRTTGSKTGAYPVRALRIGLYLLVLTRQPKSWASLLQLFWFQMTHQQATTLGLGSTIGLERQQWLKNLADDPNSTWPRDALRAQQSEYARLTRSLDRMFSTIRWSPHDRTGKKTNGALNARLKALTAEEQVALQVKKSRHDRLVNTLIAASVDRGALAAHRGDIMFDEVVIQVANRGNTGHKDHLLHAGNPDAGWWQKGDKDTPRWGHGATFIMATHRPGEKRIPTVVLSMSFGLPTGGRTAETLLAIDEAQESGLLQPWTGRGKSRYAIADMGFTQKDGLNKGLVDRGYYIVQDYPDRLVRRTVLSRPKQESNTSEERDGLHVTDTGPTLFNGVLICPGFDVLTKDDFDRLDANATEADRLFHEQRERHLLAGKMPINGRPEVAKQSGRGRPKAGGDQAIGMRVQAQCPAAAMQARCPIVLDSMALGPEIPLVPQPPKPDNLPYVCAKTTSPVLMSDKQFKQYGRHLFGSAAHERLYSYSRALNEQWHSLLRAHHTGGIDGNAFATLGVERISVFTALAVAETNQTMQRSFRQKHEPTPTTAAVA
jgi:hypothetical protein